LQTTRWDEIINKVITKGLAKGLSPELIDIMFKAIHQESINHQMKVMNDGVKNENEEK
jgi:chorismate mutase